METFFYVIGGVLVVLALGISFLGMRSDRFPSDAALRVGLLIVAIVVAATAFSAVRTSSDEQQHREDEQNREASTLEEEQATGDTQATGTPDTGGEQAPGDRQENDTQPAGGNEQASSANGDPQAGIKVFTEQGCASCHTLKAANATGTVGPDLDTELAGKDTQFIETSIVDPNADIEKGFQANIMPTDFGDVLSPEDLANVVALLEQAASSNGGNADKPASGGESGSSGG
jgi:mono/diheme cytochrome c family protein